MGSVGKWWRLGVGALVLALVVAGCSDADGDEEPAPEPSPTVTAAPSPTEPSPTEPESPAPGPTPWPEPMRPAAMERDDIEGAKAAAEYLLALQPYVYATGDLESWSRISHAACEFCDGAATYVEELHTSGGYELGGRFVISDIRAIPPDGDYEHYRVRVVGNEEPSASYSAEGKQMRSINGGDVTYVVAVLRQDDDWIIRGLALEESK